MSEHISTLLLGWFVFLLICGWLLANALIDISAHWILNRLRSRKSVTTR